LLELLEAKT
jgi:TFIIF-interacting CTD phosphatase-like protein